MMRFVETVWLVFFLVGLLLLGVFGTWSETAPFWYGAGFVCLAGIGSLLSRPAAAAQSIGWKSVAVTAVMACYIGWRGFTSEVSWLARQDLVFAGTSLVAYGLMAVRFTTPRARLAVLGVLLLLIAGNTAVGLYQYFEDPRWTVFKIFGLKRAPEVSAGGFFESANHMAGFLTMASLPLLGIAVHGRGLTPLLRVLGAIGFVLAAVAVAFSTSRGGAGGFLAGMAVLILVSAILWLNNRNTKKGWRTSHAGKWLVGLGIAFAGILLGAGFVIRQFFGKSEAMTSMNSRGPMWDAAIEQWQLSPFTGTGARSFEYMERGFRTLETKWMTWAGEVDAFFTHNDYLQTLADYGLIGLGLVLLVAGIHFWRALASVLQAAAAERTEAPSEGLATGLAIGSAAGLAGVMVQALVEFNFHIGINAVLGAVLLGWMATPGFRARAAAKSEKDSRPQPEHAKKGLGLCGRRLASAGVMTAVSILILEAGWKLAPADFEWQRGRKELKSAIGLPELITASSSFQKATTMDPENDGAWWLRGRVTLRIADLTAEKYAGTFYEAALTQLERALVLNPYNPYAAAYAGQLAEFLKRPDEADKHFQTALRWGLNIQSVYDLYGQHLLSRKEYAKAIGYLVMGLHLSSDPDTRAYLQELMQFALKKLKEQGIAPPPEAFVHPALTQ